MKAIDRLPPPDPRPAGASQSLLVRQRIIAALLFTAIMPAWGHAADSELGPESPFRYGPLVAHPHIQDRYSYGDGVQAVPGQPLTTGLHSISAGIDLRLGDRWRLDYTPTWDIYSHPAFRDVVGHAVHADATVMGTKSTWHVGHDYTYSEQPLIETGRQTAQESSELTIDSAIPITGQLAYQAAATQSLRFVEKFPDSFAWSLSQGLAYQVSSRSEISLGLIVGYDASIKMPASLLLRPLARVAWKPTEKLSLSIDAGLENRRALTDDEQELNNPAYTLTVDYRPFSQTSINLSGSAETGAALIGKETRHLETWGAQIEQRFLGHFYLSISGQRQLSKYVLFADPSLQGSRRDTNKTVEVRLRTTFLRRGVVAMFYRDTRNDSSTPGFSLKGDQWGGEIGYRY